MRVPWLSGYGDDRCVQAKPGGDEPVMYGTDGEENGYRGSLLVERPIRDDQDRGSVADGMLCAFAQFVEAAAKCCLFAGSREQRVQPHRTERRIGRTSQALDLGIAEHG